jgi:hypothetical protein
MSHPELKMSHPDEGTLHALLDHELTPAETEAVQNHFRECGACAARFAEAAGLTGESDRIVAAYELPHAARAAQAPSREVPPFIAPPPPRPDAPASSGSPIVLLPEGSPDRWPRPQRRRSLAWAATLLVAVGAGYALLVRPSPPLRSSGQDTRAQAEASGPALNDTVSPAELAARDEAPAAPESAAPETALKARSDAEAERQEQAAEPPRQLAQQRPSSAPPPAAAPSPARAKTEETRSARARTGEEPPSSAARRSETAVGALTDLGRPTMDPGRVDTGATVRLDRPAPAVEPLARDTARLDSVGAPPPAPPTTQSQERPEAAQTEADRNAFVGARRIGLDEAARELGEPLHAIDGLRRESVVLLPGRQVPGASVTGNVVRVLYRDADGEPIIFDQQRVAASPPGLRPGDTLITAAAGSAARARWMQGNIWFSLQAQMPRDSVRLLQRRVR